ncbi:MAG: hypothetical protein HGA53_07055 [Anaerolineaceae bacterium]|nr:hypothetical protein [Anaerolineaceae bacterium]NTV36696.1 hypothetical protein [Anaerolineaceae bacterium]
MLDDLRNSASNSFEEEQSPLEAEILRQPAKPKRGFLGMTAPQRFVLALMLFLLTCVLGAFCLVLTESIYLPFL